MKNYRLFLLFVVVVFAFILRFYKVTNIPPSLNWDEASIGYNAYSVLKTGRDEWGAFMPVHFKSYGEYKLPGQIYASILGIVVFGLNPLGVRITPVVYGTLTILFLYFLVLELFFNHKYKHWHAIVSCFFLAVSPWHIQLTRASFESSFALMWAVLGVWFLLKGFNKQSFWLVVSVIPFVLAMYTYNSARVFIPLFILVVGIFYMGLVRKNIKKTITSGVLFILMVIPIISFFLSGEGTARYKLVSIANDPGLVPRIEERRNLSNLPSFITNLIHNRVTYVGYYTAKNYLAHFTPNFLFIKGAFHKHHHPQGIGELYWIQMPFLLFGIYKMVKNKEKYTKLLGIWLFTSIVPASLTNDIIPHALRTLNAAPVFQIVSAYGAFYLFSQINTKKGKTSLYLLLFVFAFAFLFQFVRYQVDYFTNYAVKYSRDWQYGYKEVASYIRENYDKYDLIVFTREYGEPHMFTLFYLNYPPDKFQTDPNLNRFETYDWVRVLTFDKFYFPDLGDEGTTIDDIKKKYPDKNILFIATPEEVSKQITLKTIYFLDGKKAFEIVE